MRRRSTLILSWNGKAAVARGRYPRHDGLHIRSRHIPWPHTRIKPVQSDLNRAPRIFRIQRGSQLALSLRLSECHTAGTTERWTATEKRNIVTDK